MGTATQSARTAARRTPPGTSAPLNGTSRKARTGTTSQRRVWKCGACCKQFSVLTGTNFPGFMLYRIREAMQREPLA